MGNERTKNEEEVTEKELSELEKLACVWIESEYMDREVDRLAEYADEVGEFYELDEWTKNNPDMKDVSFMGLREHFSLASKIAFELNQKHEKNLLEKLEQTVMDGEGEFEKYKGTNIHDRLDDISDALCEDFENIYAYSQLEQVENFYKAICAILDT